MAATGTQARSRLFYFNGGFFNSRVRRILEVAGYELALGKPGQGDQIAVWGKSPTSGRGTRVGAATGAQLLHVEDAFLRSVKPGRSGEPPLGLTVDTQRPYFDSSGPSDLERLLAESPLDDTAVLSRARDNIERLKQLNLSKYNDFPLNAALPEPGYVLVIDQSHADASITHGGGTVGSFREMLVFAQEEYPGARIVIKSHPDTMDGHRRGHFGPEHLGHNMTLLDTPVSPYALLDGAIAVYTVSSGMGFEAILAGHKPVVFGQPFYAGWNLTDDRQPIDRRQRSLTRAQLFAGVMMAYPKWYDPYRDALCELEQVMDTLEARSKAHRVDRAGHIGLGIGLWKRAPLQKILGATGPKMQFARDPERALTAAAGKSLVVWARHEPDGLADTASAQDTPFYRLEDGFLRSRGLGADLVAPLSVVMDLDGIYYDPTRPSQLDHLIGAASGLPPAALRRAGRLRAQIIKHGLSKYNLGGAAPPIASGGREVIVVPGQVEDDASILKGAHDITTNAALLAQVRADHPEAFLIYKPHPDVEAGLRRGDVGAAVEADMIAEQTDPLALLDGADRVATMTSLIGFEALIRGVPVSCYGLPFYAGWGLTTDHAPRPRQRRASPTLDGLLHACLIEYPRYFDPVTGTVCPPEIAVMRLAQGDLPARGFGNRVLAKLQGALASYAHLWRT